MKLLYVNIEVSPRGLDLALPMFSVLCVWGCFSCHHGDGNQQETDQILAWTRSGSSGDI